MEISRFRLRRDGTALVVVDVQERLAAAMSRREPVVANALLLVETAKLLGVPVVHTEQYPKGLGRTVPELLPALAGAPAIEKTSFDCCAEPSFLPALEAHGRGTVVLCGMEAHVCVLQTALGLLERGLAVHVVADAVCSRRDENASTSLALLRDAGAIVTCAETVVFELLGRAGTPEFKAVLAKIR